MEKYRAGIVGLGRISAGFEDDPLREKPATHTGGYLANKKTELVSACDSDKEKLTAYGKKWQVKGLYEDVDEMLDKEKLDILSICTWNSSHRQILEKAVSKGVKAIFCEKPVSDSLSDAQAMVELCAKKGVALAVNHWRRWDRFHNELKKYIDQGAAGDIQGATFYYTAGIANTGTHLLDLLRYFFGDVAWAWATIDEKIKGQDDPSLDGYLYFKKGFGCALKGCDVKDYLIFELDILGSRARIRLYDSGDKATLWEARDSKMYSGYKELYTASLPFENPRKPHFLYSIEDIAACIGSRKEPACSGKDGYGALELIAALRKSAQTGMKVELPLKDKDFRIKSK